MCGGDAPKVEETPEQRELAKIAMEQWQLSQGELAEFENKYIAKVDALNSREEVNKGLGDANVAYNEAYDKAAEVAHGTLAAGGVDPSSGKYSASMGDLTAKRAEDTGDAMGRTEVTTDDRHKAGLQNIVAMGTGQATEATMGLGDVARKSAVDAETEARISLSDTIGTNQAIGTGAGMAAAYGLDSLKPDVKPGGVQ